MLGPNIAQSDLPFEIGQTFCIKPKPAFPPCLLLCRPDVAELWGYVWLHAGALLRTAYLSYLLSSTVILQLAVPTLFALKCEMTWAAVWRSDTTKQLPCSQTRLWLAEQPVTCWGSQVCHFHVVYEKLFLHYVYCLCRSMENHRLG